MITSNEIDNLLPQTQCEECNYKGCKPYAEAIASGEADINLCPPGGVEVVINLANLLKKDPAPYLQEAKENTRPPAKAIIREAECIGCTKCIQVCPVDAIIGTNKMMHSVFTQDCTGCRLCVDPCPVDCIDIEEIEESTFDTNRSRNLFNARADRLIKKNQAKEDKYNQKKTLDKGNDLKAKQAYILEAMKRKLSGDE